MNHAVKALIYRQDRRFLLQQRDFKPGLPFPGHWTLFGGLVEAGEDLLTAMRRELLEELGCVPGRLGSEIFSWQWHGENPAINHCFSVYCEVPDDAMVLHEGNAMSWFSIEDLGTIELTPGVSENLGIIADFLCASCAADR